MNLSIIIPAMNEEQRIAPTLTKTADYFANAEIIVVINGTTDNTEGVVKTIMKNHSNIKYITIPEKIGKGNAIIAGFKKAQGNYLSFLDADASAEPDQLEKLYKEIQQTNYAAVIGSRWIKGAIITKYQPLPRIIASRVYNLLIRFLLKLPYKDTQCGLKIFRREPLMQVLDKIVPTNWEFDVALLYALHKHGYTAKELPIIWKDNADSNLTIRKAAPKMFKALMTIKKHTK